jgi:beta-glucosidase
MRTSLRARFLAWLVTGFTVFAGSSLAEEAAPATDRPWMNTQRTADQRADLLQAQMTQDEQLQLVMGSTGSSIKLPYGRPPAEALKADLPGTAGYIPPIFRLGIPALIESDAGLGIANNGRIRPGDTATALPSGLAMAATWNAPVVEAAGSVIGAEARDRGFNIVLGGAMNLAREPRGGRTFEYAGEDPLLAGIIAGSEVRGIQSEHVVSTVKHYALNAQETGRTWLSANIDEAAGRESDLLAFEIAIERGDPGAAMCAYNRYNGTYACENDFLLNHVLKSDWKYPGWVLSDWGAVHSTIESANGGLDQESASGFDAHDFFGEPLKQALDDGKVTPARLHDMVHRILRTLFAKGVFDYPMEKRTPDLEAHRQIVQRTAEEGIVLLRNRNALLPLSHEVRRIAVVGAHSDVGVLSGGGSSQVLPIGHDPANAFPVGGGIQIMRNGAKIPPTGTEIYDPPAPLAAIRAEAPKAAIAYAGGDDIPAAVALAAQSDVVVLFAKQWMAEGRDVPNLSLPGDQDTLIAQVAAANPHLVVVLETGGPVLMPWLDSVGAVLEAWYAGNAGGVAIARILFGAVNPSGKLPITFPQSDAQLPRATIPTGSAPGMPFDIDYFEGANVGYRWFEAKEETPLFPFGVGLSYSTFHIDGLQANTNGAINIRANVKNTGKVAGMETVEIYATPPGPPDTVVRRLIGWSKVNLKPGESRRVTITPDIRLLASFDDQQQVWRIAAGDYLIGAGDSVLAQPVTTNLRLSARQLPP